MKGKTAVITGGNDGIGFQAALQLAAMEAELVIIGRNETKLQSAASRLRSAGSPCVHYVTADLASLRAVHKAADDIRSKVEKIDVLLNNAGGAFTDFSLTEDGLEKTIALNHFAYFLLTGLLLDLVKKSAYARIVNTSSDSHLRGKIDFESFTRKKFFFVMKAYAQSKLANVLFTFELAERLKNTHVTVNTLHPGTVKTTIGNKAGWLGKMFWIPLISGIGISLEEGAKTSVYLASSPEVKGITGKYFTKCKPARVNPLANDVSLRQKLWEYSENFTKFTYAV